MDKNLKILTPEDVGYIDPKQKEIEEAIKIIADNIEKRIFKFPLKSCDLNAVNDILSKYGWLMSFEWEGTYSPGRNMAILTPLK